MPAVSKKQQRLMGQAYAYKTKKIKAKELNPEYASKIKKIAKSMSKTSLSHFAKTKHNNLPENLVAKFQAFNEEFEQQMKKPIKQIVYTRREGEWEEDKLTLMASDGEFICNLEEQEGYFFTPEQLNQLLSDVIKDALNTAADKAEITSTPYSDWCTECSEQTHLTLLMKNIL